MRNLFEWSKIYTNTPECHQEIVDEFTNGTNNFDTIKLHRDFIEESQRKFGIVYGHGHRCLHYFWKLLIDEMPNEFGFLEIGVYKGQILSLIQLLSDLANKKPNIAGITPLLDPQFALYNRLPWIENLYKQFNLNMNNTKIYDGFSNNKKIFSDVKSFGLYDIVYVDGDHSYEATKYDIENYSKLIKENGFLVVDDCSNYKLFPPKMFKGLIEVSDAVRDSVEKNSQFKELLTCMHVRVWQNDLKSQTYDDFWNTI